MAKQEKTRVTVDLSTGAYQRLERLESLMEAGSKADVIREGLQLLEFMAERHSEGCDFLIRKPNGELQTTIVFAVVPAPY